MRRIILAVILTLLYIGNIICMAVNAWQASDGLNMPNSLLAALLGVLVTISVPAMWILVRHG